jgi:hypothetical protein
MNFLHHNLQSGTEGSRFIICMYNYFEASSYLGIEYEFDKNVADLERIFYIKRFLNIYSCSDREYFLLQWFF